MQLSYYIGFNHFLQLLCMLAATCDYFFLTHLLFDLVNFLIHDLHKLDNDFLDPLFLSEQEVDQRVIVSLQIVNIDWK